MKNVCVPPEQVVVPQGVPPAALQLLLPLQLSAWQLAGEATQALLGSLLTATLLHVPEVQVWQPLQVVALQQ